MAPTVITLDELGWNEALAAAFARCPLPGLEPARVAEDNRSRHVLLTPRGELQGRLTGRFRHEHRRIAEHPKVGDWVAIERTANPHEALIHAVLPRLNRFSRKTPGRETEEQVLACNLDVAFAVQALDASFNPRLLERLLLMLRQDGIQPVVVLNKTDLCREAHHQRREAESAAGGAPVLLASAHTGEGLSALRERIHPGTTVMFVGASGVGKSSLINQLLGEQAQATTEVRERDHKGRHTTSWRELILLPGGGLVIDSPGVREFHLWLAAGSLQETFPDVAELEAGCHFRRCSHTSESRCAVLEAVRTGQLPRERYQAFLKLSSELQRLIPARRERLAALRRRGSPGRPRPNRLTLPPFDEPGERYP